MSKFLARWAWPVLWGVALTVYAPTVSPAWYQFIAAFALLVAGMWLRDWSEQ